MVSKLINLDMFSFRTHALAQSSLTIVLYVSISVILNQDVLSDDEILFSNSLIYVINESVNMLTSIFIIPNVRDEFY